MEEKGEKKERPRKCPFLSKANFLFMVYGHVSLADTSLKQTPQSCMHLS